MNNILIIKNNSMKGRTMKIAKNVDSIVYLIFFTLGSFFNGFSSEDLFGDEDFFEYVNLPREIEQYKGPYRKQRIEDFKRLFTEVLISSPKKEDPKNYDIRKALKGMKYIYDPNFGTIIYNTLSGYFKPLVSKPDSAEATRETLEEKARERERLEKENELERSKQASQFHKFVKEREMQALMENQKKEIEKQKKEREVKVRN